MEKYKIINTIRKSKTNKVFLAVDTTTNEQVIIRSYLLPSEDKEKYIELCKQECYFLTQIQHPNIVRSYDLFQKGDYIFLVTEYIDGISFVDFVSQRKDLSFSEKLQTSIQIVSSIAAVNEIGIVHQNISPSNFLVRSSDNRIKLTNLGILQNFHESVERLGYLSPEQVDGKLYPNSNVFSLGVLLYQFFIHEPESPFKSDKNQVTMTNISTRTLPSLVTKISLPFAMDLAKLIETCLIKCPQKRWQSVEKFKEELEKLYKTASSSLGIKTKTAPRTAHIIKKKCTQKNTSKKLFARKLVLLMGISVFCLCGFFLYQYALSTYNQNILKNALGHFSLGIKNYNEKHYLEAWDFNNQALFLVEDNPHFLIQRARMLYYGYGTKRNIPEAEKIIDNTLSILTSSEDPIICHILGEIYYNGMGTTKDVVKAILFYEKAAKGGFTESMYALGKVYEYINRDYPKACEWYQKAAENGHPDAMGELGGIYINKLVPNANILDAEIWLKRGVNAESSLAMNNLAHMYANGIGIEKNVNKAIELYKKAMEKGLAVAYQNMGYLYFYGRSDFPLDTERGLVYLQHAANDNSTEAMYILGKIYAEGHNNISKDYEKAFLLFEKATENNHVQSMYWLGRLYWQGNGVAKDFAKAIYLFTKSGEKKLEISIVELINIYANIQKDHYKAFYWCEKGIEIESVESMSAIAQLYLKGLGTPQDLEKGIQWFRNAAYKGNVNSMYELGNIYFHGQYARQDYGEALSWYQKAGEQNHTDAINNLGVMYLSGRGVQKNWQQAMTLFLKSAQMENETAMYNLGQMYELGLEGAPQNRDTAIQWYQKASQKGDKKSQTILEKLLNENY